MGDDACDCWILLVLTGYSLRCRCPTSVATSVDVICSKSSELGANMSAVFLIFRQIW
jgi:hypothetical protein